MSIAKKSRMNLFQLAAVVVCITASQHASAASAAEEDRSRIQRGQYVATVSGCNDCHTDGYLLSNGKVPVDQWLKGSGFGWRGPWGTTYPPNLRIFVSSMTEDRWVATAKSLKRRPPMPWFNLNAMVESDLRALYQFIRSLGETGKPAPAYLPPGEEPKTPYALFPSPPEEK
jgi:mono/diheme cytochrome c family protein